MWKAEMERVLNEGVLTVEVAQDRYHTLVNHFPTDENGQNEWRISLVKLLQKVLRESSAVVSRETIKHIADTLSPVVDQNNQRQKIIAESVLESLQDRALSFEDQVVSIRHHLASIYEKENEWIKAAEILEGMLQSFTNGQKSHSDEEKLKVYVKIAQLYLQENKDNENKDNEYMCREKAEDYINKAAHVACGVKNETSETMLLFKATQARVLDVCKNEFVEAARKYNEISQWQTAMVSEKDKIAALQRALKCTVLSRSGKQRSRMLATLFKDDRCKNLQGRKILEKMYLDRILQSSELQEFSELLEEHQKVNECKSLKTAFIQHNLHAVSKLYSNIKTEELAKLLLQIDADTAEKHAAEMIGSGNIEGYIDQIDGYVYFEAQEVLESFDDQIRSLCSQVNEIAQKIEKRQPDWKANLPQAMDTS